jgi:hypothetical protein
MGFPDSLRHLWSLYDPKAWARRTISSPNPLTV